MCNSLVLNVILSGKFNHLWYQFLWHSVSKRVLQWIASGRHGADGWTGEFNEGGISSNYIGLALGPLNWVITSDGQGV